MNPAAQFADRPAEVTPACAADEAIVNGKTKEPKTLTSEGMMYLAPDLALALRHYLETIDPRPMLALSIDARAHTDVTGTSYDSVETRGHPRRRRDHDRRKVYEDHGRELPISAAHVVHAVRGQGQNPKLNQAHMRHADPHVTETLSASHPG